MELPELINVLPVSNELGEGVLWDSERAVLWWTDIQARLLYLYEPGAERLERWPTPERLASFGLVAGQDDLIAGFESGFAYFDPASATVNWIQAVERDQPGTRLNDGRVDRQGRFWAGSMVENGPPGRGALYCLDRQLTCSKPIDGLSISNGLCWSPDSSCMYHTDTPTGRIDRYDFDSVSAGVSKPVIFAQTDPGCSPDGSTVDTDGYLWNAQWGGSQVVRYSPIGEVDLVLPTPASQPTCVAFGGPDLDLLFVTSARQGLNQQALAKEPEAGNLFIYQTGVNGLEEARFRPQGVPGSGHHPDWML